MKLLSSIKRRSWKTDYYQDGDTCVMVFTRDDGAQYTGYVDMFNYDLVRSLPLYPALTRGVYLMYCEIINGKHYMKYLHKTLLSDPYLQTDHIDMNPLNNRMDNLRLVTCSENLRNASMQSNNVLGRKGLAVSRGKDGEFTKIRACYPTENGQKEKSFSINKYGYESALRMTNEFLDEKQRENKVTPSFSSRVKRLGF